MHFQDLKLIPPLIKALQAKGYERPTAIQQRSIPHVLAGKDILGSAQTGTGKTAAFALPILQRLVASQPQTQGKGRAIRTLVLTPTRELATQIGDSFSAYGKFVGLRNFVIFGGVGQGPQTAALRQGTDILIATPGRLLDLMGQGYVSFSRLEIFVLDEADRMLDMGFIHDVRKIVAVLPRQRQTLFFSATMPADIQALSKAILIDPVRIDVTPDVATPEKIAQSIYFVDKPNKPSLLAEVLKDKELTRVIVFTRTKHGADKVVRHLAKCGIPGVAIHGNKSQGARERALDGFKTGRSRVLIATDIAARGLDVQDISHVINYDLPEVAETYIHRIGRTARAGAGGRALSFCDPDERGYFRDIERLIRIEIPVISDHAYPSTRSASGGSGRPQPHRQQRHNQPHSPGRPRTGPARPNRAAASVAALLKAPAPTQAPAAPAGFMSRTRSPGRTPGRRWGR